MDLVKEILLDIHKDVGVIKSDQTEIKVDLRNHIKRTDLLEERVQQIHDTDIKWLKKHIWMAYGAIGLVTFALTILKALKG